MADNPEPDAPAEDSAEEPAGAPSRGTAAGRQEELLRQIATLTRSVQELAESARGKPPPAPPPPDGQVPDADAQDRRRVAFAYLFIGEALGRRGFRTPRVQVTRAFNGLTFTGLGTGTAARLRAADGTTDLLQNLRDGVLTPTAIPNRQPIDSVVVLESPDGVAVALGPCLAAVDDIIIE